MQDSTIAQQLDILERFPEALRQQVQGLDAAALRYRPEPNTWSVAEIVGHIMEVEALWAGRIRQMLAAEHPALASYDQEEAVRQRDFQNKHPGGMLITFAERRAEHVAFLRGLRPVQLTRTGEHPTRGSVSVADSIGILLGHDRAHSDQIAANLEGYQRAVAGGSA